MKGISPMIATVLLIAFTVAIGGLISTWLSGFTTTSTETIGKQADISLICSYGGLNIKSLQYNTTISALSGQIENTGTIPLGNLSIQIIYQNATNQKFNLCNSASSCINCSSVNASLSSREQCSFNLSIASNYDKIRVISNCSTAYDEASRSDVS